jgi:hypothetical protein
VRRERRARGASGRRHGERVQGGRGGARCRVRTWEQRLGWALAAGGAASRLGRTRARGQWGCASREEGGREKTEEGKRRKKRKKEKREKKERGKRKEMGETERKRE